MSSVSTRFPRAVVVHGRVHARAALEAGAPVTLLSAPGAALFVGCGVWRALTEQARREMARPDAPDILDCADASGYALAALRIGCASLILHPAAPGRDAVTAIASRTGAVLLTERPPALDLARRGAERRLLEWLRADDFSGGLG